MGQHGLFFKRVATSGLWATLALTYGHDGAMVAHHQNGVALNTITAGKRELEKGPDDNPDRIRRLGGGAKSIELR
jgi:hypothetical protein